MTIPELPPVKALYDARMVFLKNEPRDLFYRIATELIELAIKGKTKITLSEALAVLLQTWNRYYYQFRHFDNEHFKEIDHLVEDYAEKITSDFRTRSIYSLCESDKNKIYICFGKFEEILGPVGAAKSLHLLAPRFFPLWDRSIAEKYIGHMGPRGTNAKRYWNFIEITRDQCEKLKGKLPYENNPLKLIDEYNYCHYTRRGI